MPGAVDRGARVPCGDEPATQRVQAPGDRSRLWRCRGGHRRPGRSGVRDDRVGSELGAGREIIEHGFEVGERQREVRSAPRVSRCSAEQARRLGKVGGSRSEWDIPAGDVRRRGRQGARPGTLRGGRAGFGHGAIVGWPPGGRNGREYPHDIASPTPQRTNHSKPVVPRRPDDGARGRPPSVPITDVPEQPVGNGGRDPVRPAEPSASGGHRAASGRRPRASSPAARRARRSARRRR